MPINWNCQRCGRLLAKVSGEVVHIRSARGQEYKARLPVECACRRCGAFNDFAAPESSNPTVQPR